jgi:hypothetical protein
VKYTTDEEWAHFVRKYWPTAAEELASREREALHYEGGPNDIGTERRKLGLQQKRFKGFSVAEDGNIEGYVDTNAKPGEHGYIPSFLNVECYNKATGFRWTRAVIRINTVQGWYECYVGPDGFLAVGKPQRGHLEVARINDSSVGVRLVKPKLSGPPLDAVVLDEAPGGSKALATAAECNALLEETQRNLPQKLREQFFRSPDAEAWVLQAAATEIETLRLERANTRTWIPLSVQKAQRKHKRELELKLAEATGAHQACIRQLKALRKECGQAKREAKDQKDKQAHLQRKLDELRNKGTPYSMFLTNAEHREVEAGTIPDAVSRAVSQLAPHFQEPGPGLRALDKKLCEQAAAAGMPLEQLEPLGVLAVRSAYEGGGGVTLSPIGVRDVVEHLNRLAGAKGNYARGGVVESTGPVSFSAPTAEGIVPTQPKAMRLPLLPDQRDDAFNIVLCEQGERVGAVMDHNLITETAYVSPESVLVLLKRGAGVWRSPFKDEAQLWQRFWAQHFDVLLKHNQDATSATAQHEQAQPVEPKAGQLWCVLTKDATAASVVRIVGVTPCGCFVDYEMLQDVGDPLFPLWSVLARGGRTRVERRVWDDFQRRALLLPTQQS